MRIEFSFRHKLLRLAITTLAIVCALAFCNIQLHGQEKGAGDKATENEPKEDEGTEKENKTAAEKVSGKIVVINGDDLKIDFANAKFVLEERFVSEPPKLPEDWSEKTPAEQQEWATNFLASPEGEAYQKKQEELFENRKVLEIIVDDTGAFELKEVPFNDYFLQGTITATKGTKNYSADVYASISVNEDVDHVELGELEVEVFPFLKVGDPAPAIELEPLDGEEKISLKDLHGKYVLLDFWATWCRPCIEATPSVMDAHKSFSAQGKLQVIGISQDDDKKLALKYVEKKELPWLQAFSGPEHETATIEFGVQSIPSFWLIDPDGIIVAKPDDFFDANLDIEKVLKEKIK